MTRISPSERSAAPDMRNLLAQAEASMGYLPNDVLSLSHWPELLQSLGGLVGAAPQSGDVDSDLKRLIGIISTRTQGCTYCAAHSSYGAHKMGVMAEKLPTSSSSKDHHFSQMQSELH